MFKEVLPVIPLHNKVIDAKFVCADRLILGKNLRLKVGLLGRLALGLAATRECAESYVKGPFSGN